MHKRSRLLLSISLLAPLHTRANAPSNSICEKIFQRASTGQKIPLKITLSDIENKIFAVHTTNYIPSNGVIRAGQGSGPVFRPTIHFSLGSIVSNHSLGNNWSGMPYAVIMPLKSIAPKTVNLMSFDTIVLGNLPIPTEGVLVIPKHQVELAPTGVRVFAYDPQELSIRSAIDQAIQREGGWSIDAPRGVDSSDVAVLREDPLRRNLNSPAFFAPLFKKNPELSFGLHVASELGEADHIGQIDRWTNYHLYGWPETGTSHSAPASLKFEKAVLEKDFKSVQALAQRMQLSGESRLGFEEHERKLKAWLNILDAEIWLSETRGKGFLWSNTKLSKTQRAKIMLLANQPEDLRKFLLENIDHLASSHLDRLPAPTIVETFSRFEPATVQELRSRFPSETASFGRPDQYLQYALQRTGRIGTEAARAEGIDSWLSKSMNSTHKAFPNFDPMEEITQHLSHPELSSEIIDHRVQTSMQLLNFSKIRDTLNSLKGPALPHTLRVPDDLFRVLPNTRGAYVQELPKIMPESHAFVTAFKFPIETPPPPYGTYSEALYAARTTAKNREMIPILADMASSTPAQLERKGGDYYRYAANYWWKDLGLDAEFHSVFSSQESYMASVQTIGQIHNKLMKLKGSPD